jgi:mannitol-specific phosphotransferase system IIBC component
MKTIKKYWAIIAGVILAIIAAIFVSDKLNKKKVTKLDKKIDDNNQQIDQLQGKTEVIEEQRVEIKEEFQLSKIFFRKDFAEIKSEYKSEPLVSCFFWIQQVLNNLLSMVIR